MRYTDTSVDMKARIRIKSFFDGWVGVNPIHRVKKHDRNNNCNAVEPIILILLNQDIAKTSYTWKDFSHLTL